MKAKTAQNLMKSMQKRFSKNASAILAGIGITSIFTTAVLVGKETPKALKAIEEKKNELKKDALTPMETLSVTWTCYVPAIVSGVTGAFCIIGAQTVNAKKYAALATAYKISTTTITEYKDKVKKILGEEKEQNIRNQIAQDKVDQITQQIPNVVIASSGKYLCLDKIFRQQFESDIESIREAVNNINYQMITNQYMSLNEFYDELNIDRIPIGDDLGWNISKHGPIELDFSSAITKDKRPCIIFEYVIGPQYDYWKY